jgi:hypothetical protein
MTGRPQPTRRISKEIRAQAPGDAAAAEVLRKAAGVCQRCGTYGGARKVVDRGELQAECLDHPGCHRRMRTLIEAEAEGER